MTRNIFSRDRTAASYRSKNTFSRPTDPVFSRNEPELVLTGVVVQDDLRVAFFEDSQTGQTYRVAAGKPLGAGTVEHVWLDGIQYRTGPTTRRIGIGENLSGQAGTLRVLAASTQPAAAVTAAGAPAGGPTAASGPGSPAENMFNSVLERMRQRRQQENRR